MQRIMVLPFFVLALTLSACVTPTKVTKLGESGLAGQPKKLALLNGTEFDPDIRLALAQYGFKVVKYVSTRRIERDTSEITRESFNKAEVKFGLSVYPGRMVDYCIVGSAIKLARVAFEVTNLEKNETVLYIHAGGWSEPCASYHEIVWDKLAEELAKNWR
jgi:hypothetical protein